MRGRSMNLPGKDEPGPAPRRAGSRVNQPNFVTDRLGRTRSVFLTFIQESPPSAPLAV
jgi:hypothetical protein